MREYLDVPYHEKDEARGLGARWDSGARRWYVSSPAAAERCARWAAKADLPDLLPGEDRAFGDGLFVDLVPASCWFTNVRSCVSKADWERLRRMVVARAGERCEICGAREDRRDKLWLEAHERWDYDEARLVQTLKRIICLCTDCHAVTHFGFSLLKGREWVWNHLMDVTGMDMTAARAHVSEAFVLWEERSEREWALDLSILTDVDIMVAPPPAPGERIGHAARSVD